MTLTEFKHHFEISYLQYTTIDNRRCERFGDLVQGFVGVRVGENARIIPFQFVRRDFSKALEEIVTLNESDITNSDYIGVSFVQHYIHYSHSSELCTNTKQSSAH